MCVSCRWPVHSGGHRDELLGAARLAVRVHLPGPAVGCGQAQDGGGHCQQENNLCSYCFSVQKSLICVFREFRLGESPLPSLYNTVSSVMFAQNMVVLRKQTRGETRYFDKSYR